MRHFVLQRSKQRLQVVDFQWQIPAQGLGSSPDLPPLADVVQKPHLSEPSGLIHRMGTVIATLWNC